MYYHLLIFGKKVTIYTLKHLYILKKAHRDLDYKSLYSNNKNLQTTYKDEISDAVHPVDYQNHQHVKKGLQT